MDNQTMVGEAFEHYLGAEPGKAWAEFATFEPDELVLRFHHRLVWIHPFANGNGRHGRVCAGYLARALDRPPFSWGAKRGDTTTACHPIPVRAREA